MTTMKFTQAVKDHVAGRIRTLCNAEVDEACPALKNGSRVELDATELYNLGAFGEEHLHLIGVIPKSWMTAISSGEVYVVDDSKAGIGLPCRVFLNFIGLTGAYRRPSNTNQRSSLSDSTLHISKVRELAERGVVGAKELAQRSDDEITSQAIRVRFANMHQEIVDFLNETRSLNEAVKIMPHLKLYLHPDTLASMDFKPARAAQERDRLTQLQSRVPSNDIVAAAMAGMLAGVT